MWGALWDEGTGLSFPMLLTFTSPLILGSKSRRTHGHILLSQTRLPQPGGPGPFLYVHRVQGGLVIPPPPLANPVTVTVTLRLALYDQSLPLGTKSLAARHQKFFFCNRTLAVILSEQMMVLFLWIGLAFVKYTYYSQHVIENVAFCTISKPSASRSCLS
jgi:hypothetical protein